MSEILPVLFVGSSSESLKYLPYIKEILTGTVELKVWDTQIFNPALGNYLSDIIIGIQSANCALFIFAPDDKRIMRDKEEYVTRDNVIFETGIAIGVLGKSRVFILSQQNTVLPKDLDGLTVYRFQVNDNESYNTNLRNELERFKENLIGNVELLHKSPVYLSEYVSENIHKCVRSSKTIWAISPMLSSFLETYEAEIRMRFEDNNNPLYKLIAVLRDPWGKTKSLITVHSDRYSESTNVFNKITSSISTLQKLRMLYPDKVDIHILDHPFMCSSYIFDPDTDNCKVCVQYNPLGDVARLPQIYLSNNRQFWNKFFVSQAYEYINKSKKYPATYIVLSLKDVIGSFEEEIPLLKLWKKGYTLRGYRGDESAIKKLNEDTIIVLAKDKNKLVGFSIINSTTGKRRATVVDSKYRNRGIAFDMVRESLIIIKNQYSEVNYQSFQMQTVLGHNGFRRMNTKTEITNRINSLKLEFKYEDKQEIMLYRRSTTMKSNNKGMTDWLILYEYVSS